MKYGWNIENELTFGELSRDFYYANLLVDSIMAEDLPQVRDLLETKRANPNTVMPELGVAPLHLLAGLENEDFSSTVTLQAILRSGGDPNVRSEEGLTPVHVAAMWGRCKVLDILLANGGDPELIDYKLFLNAEEYAIREQQWKAFGVIGTFSVLVEEGCNMNAELEHKPREGGMSTEISTLSNDRIKNKHLMKLKNKVANHFYSSSTKGSENSYSTVRKKRNKKKNQSDDELRSDRSSWSKNTIKLLNPDSAVSTIKRQSSSTKDNKNNRLKSDQTDDESQSDQSYWSKNTTKTSKLNEEVLSTVKRQSTPRINKKNNRPKRDQIDDESQSNQSYWSKNTTKTIKPNTVKRQSTTEKKKKEIDTNYQTNNESFSDRSDLCKSTIQSLKLNDSALSAIKTQRRKTNIYESIGDLSDKVCSRSKQTGKEPKEKYHKLSLYGDSVSESCDWIRKSANSIKLDKKALDTIKNQRLSSKIYQTKGLGEDPLNEREKKPPIYEESEVCDWVDPRNSAIFDESSLNKIKIHRTRTRTYKSEEPENRTMMCSGPTLPKRNRQKHHTRQEDSEMFLCGFTESSIRTNEHRPRLRYPSSGLSDVNSSDFDERGMPNQRMLCKMSRLFLFMLKKRHIYQKIK